nr:unnamed protein product [Digitaria exilis]
MNARGDAQPAIEPGATRDLSELPRNAIALLGPIGILMGAGLLCHSWLDAAMVPELWRSVDMASPNIAIAKMKFWTAMAKKAVDRSDGQLEVFG